jgi:hypothetical protein
MPAIISSVHPFRRSPHSLTPAIHPIKAAAAKQESKRHVKTKESKALPFNVA